LVLFTQKPSLVWTPWSQPCQFCKETEQLVQELTQLSPLLEADIHDIDHEGALAERYGVDKVPALIVTDGNITNIRYFGIPAGMEFTALIEDIVMVSQGTTNLSEEVREKIHRIQKPVHIQVFVMPTCPYCPKAVRTAHQFAMENPHIVADMVEATEFAELAVSRPEGERHLHGSSAIFSLSLGVAIACQPYGPPSLYEAGTFPRFGVLNSSLSSLLLPSPHLHPSPCRHRQQFSVG
jgi:glutaredoxin-like protein